MTEETTATPSVGTEGLNLNQATSAIEAMLGNDEPEGKEQPQAGEGQQEESENEGEDNSGDEEQEEGKEESGEDQEQETELSYEVTLPGGEKVNVPVTELLKGYSREADYTKKTTALADQRKQLTEEIEAKSLQKEAYLRNEYVGKLEQIEQMLSGAPNVDWAELEASNPQEFLRLKMKEIERKEALEITQKEKNRLIHEDQQKQQAQYQESVKKHFDALIEKAPEFRDPAKGPKLFSEINGLLAESGYSKEEIEGLVDHRALLLVRDAFRYRQMQNTAKKIIDKKVVTVPQVQKPGAARDAGSNKTDQRKATFNQLRKSGSTKDAAKHIEQFL